MLAANDIQSLRLILWSAALAMLLWLGVAGLPYPLWWLVALWGLQGAWLALSRTMTKAWPLVVDMALLTLLFAGSGGHTNPFVSLYLLPVVIALLAKAERQALWVALAAALGYSTLMLLPEDQGWHRAGHYWGMWANTLLTLVVLLLFAGNLNRLLRRQGQAISQLREQQLRAEQVMAVAAQAALAAHQLATPLSVARLTADELAEESPDPRLADLQRALGRCALQLQKVREAAEPAPAAPKSLAALLEDLAERFRLLRPGTQLQLPAAQAGQVQSDATLVPAILNLLDNAAHQGEAIKLRLLQEPEHWLLQIGDGGPGLAPELAKALGQPLPSDRHPGPGLGLFLAHVSLERLGGFLRIKGDERQSWVEVGLKKA
ncbi:ATP-binding protein [Gallaecimonas xiamenensis]|uniref:histidine kinase n=1 Tax=Gallaecimonas xiamenensis 3-C-1 TaxID=745411 RepID=K2JML5_9GAMM|nr:ATP-binding protein [Gallaecimonas xiamenensis]EKE71699.1 putative sensor histidine kinase [Gallaecimonas xiamenensis 3-C-1]